MKRYKEYKEKERDRERDGEYKERDRGRYREYKDNERDRERESRHIERSREKERDGERKHGSRSRERFGHRSRDIEISRERNKDRERKHRSRSRERYGRRSRDIERSRERNKDRERKHRSRSRERFGYRSIDIERSRERNRDRGRKHRSRSRERSGCRSRDIERYMDACQELIEFYSVTVTTNSSRNPYGTIKISDGTGDVIYNRYPNSDNCYETNLHVERQVDESTYEISNLTAPSVAKGVYDSFSIVFELKSEDSPLPNKEMIRGYVHWDPYGVIEYDKVIQGVVKGEYGTASLYYAVFEKAFQAQVEVNLIHGGGAKSFMVTEINAFNSCIEHKKILLYREDSGQGTLPLHDIHLPLLRPTVVVPFDGTLTIELELVMLEESGSNTIAIEPVVFKPKPCGHTKKKIENHYGEIEVNVKWFSD